LIISQLDLKSDVKIFQNINDNQLAFLYKFAYLSIYPSFYEGCGLPILESNSFGIPTAVSDIERISSLCPSSSIVFNPFDVDSIASSINLAITDVELYNRLKTNTIEEIKKYSWAKSANELYESLIN
jgi:glycosyltransferase involved in cell wall biosynthesis